MRKICLSALGFAVALSLFASPAAAQDGCEAFVQATLETNEQGETTMLEFDVEVSTSEDCAKIEYDLVLNELLPNGQTKMERIPRLVTLSDGGYDEVVEHKISSALQLLSHEAKVVSCQICTIMP